ncbi:MAG TPA: glycogen/starch/alpha-glucan phosphorylase [Deltaproteobacteria bacterium]|nr:glycogen/starch/alpha-glucan phosphorylase [SAR324 cluster bacterium]HHZ78178.1 glycogen/starch/alpha-glucan phosphorylase [Candidatus Lambdaproteobacteria bacterium]HIB93880.1 glycogen/starch/alpha-glucan phosphorylase [Candidatus Lambdaproteobacteria bacterium]HIN47129.1 glycogen/starch/alpha-glucan phosphorylase [Deltaproteobacteria bacterium]HIO83254.1 glycogen/starch/alpha-glucan phosphorylase [Deltaproteobacteria bacterium]
MPNTRKEMEIMWDLIATYRSMDRDGLIESIANHIEFSQCKNRYTAEDFDIYRSFALSIRDRLVEFWNDTQQTYQKKQCKQVYYFSLEYLIGRSLKNNLLNLGIMNAGGDAIRKIGYDLEELQELEHDAGLGNGGLGRLAACFLESMATLQLPAHGYGIRYEFGIFKQQFENGAQVEAPDNWLEEGYPWEIPRMEIVYPVHFFGHLKDKINEKGESKRLWVETEEVMAMAYDVPIAGFGNHTVNNLRLWSAKPSKSFDFQLFNSGDYIQAVEETQRSGMISKVLYPNDQGFSGKELRLKQQYFFVAASLQDIIQSFKKHSETFESFPEHVAIQLNDTHPSIAIPELMRILIDEEDLGWDEAWDITTRVFAYTNHTVLPEALESWSVDLMGRLLPRHLEIIYEINDIFLEDVKKQFPDDADLLRRISFIEENDHKQIRMPYLSIVGSHTINGVAVLHTELLKTTVFKDFYKLFPERFQNKTNGITPRLWLRNANPELSELITEKIGDGWITELQQLRKLEPFADDPEFQDSWRTVKRLKKEQLAKWLKQTSGVVIDPVSLFDVQIKRIHEYKRQLLNILHVVFLYNKMLEHPEFPFVPRTILLGGKAAPGYYMAKLIINLANDVAHLVNNDPAMKDRLKVVFVPNYNVSVAEKLIPATDISQHISTAGTEASGTGNMKFILNGALILGTMDGANIEIAEEVGAENFFTFGLSSDEINSLAESGYNPRVSYQNNPELREVLSMINTGYFNRDKPHLYNDLYNSLVFEDKYMLLEDFASYVECQQRVMKTWADTEKWTKMSILNTAASGKFSSDRTIAEYAKDIWELEPVTVELQGKKVC